MKLSEKQLDLIRRYFVDKPGFMRKPLGDRARLVHMPEAIDRTFSFTQKRFCNNFRGRCRVKIQPPVTRMAENNGIPEFLPSPIP